MWDLSDIEIEIVKKMKEWKRHLKGARQSLLNINERIPTKLDSTALAIAIAI